MSRYKCDPRWLTIKFKATLRLLRAFRDSSGGAASTTPRIVRSIARARSAAKRRAGSVRRGRSMRRTTLRCRE
jgi:hypothetical protein